MTALNGGITATKVVTLSWLDPSDNEQGFKVYRNGVEVATLPASPGLGSVRSYTESVPGASGTVYRYEVAPFNGAGIAAKSNTVTLTVPGAPVPPAPSGLSVVVGQRTAALGWRDSPSEIGFQIQRDGVVVGETNQDQVVFQDNKLQHNHTYTWAVRGIYPGGVTSAWSASVRKKTLR